MELSSPEMGLADLFLRALVEKDKAALQTLIHAELYFHTPWLELGSGEDFLTATRRLWERSKQIVARGKWLSNTRALIVYDLFFEKRITTVRLANVLSFKGGKVSEIEQFYDLQPLENLLAIDGNTFREIEFFYEARDSLAAQ
jgi:hypothetical protein